MASLQFPEPAGTIRATQLSATTTRLRLRQNVNRAVSSPASSAAAFGSLNANRTHSLSSSPSIQNQRVAQILQATGHQISSSTASTNRFHSPAQNKLQQFYAPIFSPSSPAVANQQNRSGRPPVPLFKQGIGNQQNPAKMDLQGKSSTSSDSSRVSFSPPIDALSLEDFTAFEGGATTAYSSPGIPGYDVNVSSASSCASNLGTVSPQDLLIRDPFASAPNSTAITNLTSPSMYGESPEFHDNYEVSPNFEGGDFDGGSNDKWFSLFPEQNTIPEPAPIVEESPVQQPEEQQSEEPEATEKPSQSRRKSPNSPPTGGHGRHSSVSGVNSRRRDKPLPPIVIDDPNDTVAMKRARNTLAARKSRQRKAERFEELEEKIQKLEEERDYWKNRALNGDT
ncbi:General control protein [Hypoxylon texense]